MFLHEYIAQKRAGNASKALNHILNKYKGMDEYIKGKDATIDRLQGIITQIGNRAEAYREQIINKEVEGDKKNGV